MGVKKILPTFQVVSAGVMTGTATVLAVASNIQNHDNIGFQVTWTGTPTGTLSVLASADGVNFYPYTVTQAPTQPAGSGASTLITLNQCPFPWVKLKYVNASGTGTLNAWICGKDIN